MKRYLVSGLPPGPGGLGRFLTRLCSVAQSRGWGVLLRPQREQKGVLRHLFDLVRFYTKLRTLRNARLVILHPQTLRWNALFSLVRSNTVMLYVVDNSFFCIRSYNYRGQEWKECLDCLGDLDRCHGSCSPFPVFYDRSRNLKYLKVLEKTAPGITFLVQNHNQGRLLKRHFGTGVSFRRTGMVTDEFTGASRTHCGPGQFDVVFHGAVNAAKGAGYAIALARHLPDLTFLFPGRQEEALELSGDAGVPGNVSFWDITWETGLREQVEKCRIVLCPSLWSAPIEGALVKSILHNGRVAVFDTEFGYQAELPQDLVIRLGPDLEKAARKITDALLTDVTVDPVKKWIEGLVEETDLESIFT